MQSTILVKDPVCGMDVEVATASERTEYQGQSYYFCASACKEKFDRAPEKYLSKAAAATKSSDSCCS